MMVIESLCSGLFLEHYFLWDSSFQPAVFETILTDVLSFPPSETSRFNSTPFSPLIYSLIVSHFLQREEICSWSDCNLFFIKFTWIPAGRIKNTQQYFTFYSFYRFMAKPPAAVFHCRRRRGLHISECSELMMEQLLPSWSHLNSRLPPSRLQVTCNCFTISDGELQEMGVGLYPR